MFHFCGFGSDVLFRIYYLEAHLFGGGGQNAHHDCLGICLLIFPSQSRLTAHAERHPNVNNYHLPFFITLIILHLNHQRLHYRIKIVYENQSNPTKHLGIIHTSTIWISKVAQAH